MTRVGFKGGLHAAHRPPAALSDGGGCGSCRLSWRRSMAATAPRTPPSFRGYFFLLAVWTRSGATYGERFEPSRIEPRKAEGELLSALDCARPLCPGPNTRMASIRITRKKSPKLFSKFISFFHFTILYISLLFV